jgi:diguanylate cyclase (GGDEF)-like protein
VPYALGLVVAALIAIGLVAVEFPLRPEIAIGDPGLDPSIAIALGLALWLVFGLVGSVRPRDIAAGNAVITFHAPFVIAGTILGGPLAGALMGVISITEAREIRRGPWYGVLANHATCVIAAVASGIMGKAAEIIIGPRLPGRDAVDTLVIGVVMAGTFVAVNLLLVLPVISMRSGMGLLATSRRAAAILRITLLAEVTLGWLMAVTYLWIAWWAPLVCVIVIVAVWDAYARREELRRDPMTGLLNDAGIQPILDQAVHESQRQLRRHALVFIDLDGFGKLNKVYGEDVGDEVIRAVAGRLGSSVRGSDAVGRQNRAGDEFVVLLRDLTSDELALRLAWRVHENIMRPIRVRGASVEVSVGASIGVAIMSPGRNDSVDRLKRIADERMQAIKRAGGGVFALPEPSASMQGETIGGG